MKVGTVSVSNIRLAEMIGATAKKPLGPYLLMKSRLGGVSILRFGLEPFGIDMKQRCTPYQKGKSAADNLPIFACNICGITASQVILCTRDNCPTELTVHCAASTAKH